MRLPCLILLASLGHSPFSMAQRTELHLFQYGRTNTPQAQAAFLDFRDLLAGNLPILAQEVSQGHTLPSVDKLKLRSVTGDDNELQRPESQVGSLEQRRNYWRDTGALGLLTGHVSQKGNVPQIHTRFYWGTLGVDFGNESIELTLPVVGSAFDSTNDSHAVAILYALAHDTKHAKCQQISASLHLLSEAHKRAQAVAIERPEVGLSLTSLVESAIKKIRRDCNE